jgi:MFS family permease
MNSGSDHSIPVRLVAIVLVPFSAGYFLSYMFRAINAVVAPNLVSDLTLDATQLGLVTAAYLVAFAVAQLPLGLALDRYGPRRVQTVLLLAAACGSVLFSIAEDVVGLALARGLIGFGFAGGLMASFKAIVLWFPASRHALVNSAVMSVGGLGMLAATLPAEYAVQMIGWRNLFLVTASLTALVAILIFFIVPERESEAKPSALRDQLRGIARIFSDPLFWRIAPLVATTSGGHIGIHTLWAGPWFRDIAGLGRDGVAWHLLAIALAFLVGTLLGGVVADRLARRGITQLQVMTAGLGLFVVAQVAIIAELVSINAYIWMLFGMTGQLGMLAYPTLARHFGTALSGRAQTAMNLLLFSTAFAAQSMIGAIIDLFPHTADSYSSDGYRTAFAVLLVTQLAAFAWYYFPRPQKDFHD